MNKDVVYIDVDEDITEVIGKVKKSKEKIVALVPPKRTGVLQSVVNLRILDHAAKGVKKRIVLISNDQALTTLAASVKIPIAKNLQSKPEVPSITALKVDDDDDIIDGADLPVGDHASASKKSRDSLSGVALADIDIDGTKDAAGDYAKPPEDGKLPPKPNKRKKVPNFNNFRKKLLLIGGALVLLIGAFVWAHFFAYSGTVLITAKTHDEQLNSSVQLVPNKPTDASNGIMHSIVESEKKDMSTDFTATGEKEIGEKAEGTVEFSTNAISNVGQTVPAGTELTSSSGMTYVTTESATFSLGNSGGISVGITANDIGDEYNGATGSMSGVQSDIDTEITTSPTGGSKETIKVVTQEDVQKASEELVDEEDSDMKENLQRKFSKDTYVISDSYEAKGTEAESSPKVGEEAKDGKATLETTMTYTMTGIDYSDIEQFINEAIQAKLPQENSQRVYEAGEREADISDFNSGEDNTATISIVATSKVGPDIDTDDIKKRVKGKQFGDIQRDIESISGVNRVDLDIFPFWMKNVPEDVDRITVKFDMQENAS